MRVKLYCFQVFLALIFLYHGIYTLFTFEAWALSIPAWVLKIQPLDATVLTSCSILLDLLFALWLFLPWKTHSVSLAAATYKLLFVLAIGLTPSGMKELAFAGSLFALSALTWPAPLSLFYDE